ncbi:MAG: NAD(P)-dependent oxidoreductase [Lysinibacillus sp.]
MKIYFTFEPRENLKMPLIEQFPEIDFVFHKRLDEAELADTDILVTYGTDLNEERIEMLKQVRWIFVASAGLELLPKEAIAERGIYVSNVRGIHKKPMAESILAHILSYKRALKDIYEHQAKATWNNRIQQTELNGSTALILGPGAIGQEIGRILQAFDVHTIGCNTTGEPVSYMNETHRIDNLMEELPQADIVISILPSTENTKHLLKREHFEVMKDSAMFLNFGRADVVETDVLVEALEDNLIAYAVLDVFDEEPLLETSKFWSMKNVVVSPHVSSHSSRYVERSLDIFKPSLREYLNGEKRLLNEVNILRGY